ncbi:hypothetical protein TtJL18_0824 [Thermus thermophilus JL-18]|uniref:Replication protein n=1 Tax=Thermus thermophilus JL-18 TaxID=798128 RepID=H9ZQW6_THETH|nr:hypothetical protein TtJL18_0824 [Thermus thermophilus JL-18]
MSTTISIARPQLRKAYRTFHDLLGPDGAHPRPGPRWVRRALTGRPSRLPPPDPQHPFWAAVLNFTPATGGDKSAPELPSELAPEALPSAIALFTAAAIVGHLNPTFSPDERRAFAKMFRSVRAALRPSPSPEAIRISLALLRIRQLPRPRVQPPSRVMAPARPRESPGRGAAPPTGPPGEEGGESQDEESDGEPPSPSLRPRRARGRGRPRGARRFKAHASPRVYHRRIGALNAVAEALEGRADGLFLTLVPLTPPDDRDRRLAAVPPDVAQAFARFASRLRRAGATYALVVATRAENGTFWPHAHGIVAGVARDKLTKWAAREGLKLHAEPLRNPQAAVRYMARGAQKGHFDSVLGARGFYAAVSSRKAPRQGSALPAPEAIPPGLELVPGVRIADVPTFLAALAQDLESRLPAVRGAARHHLALVRAALAERGPP